MRVVASIEARMGSTRLPGKVLKKILGRPMLHLMIERVQNSREINDLVVATSVNPKDERIVKLCNDLDVKVFRGSEEDVLQRVVDAVESVNGDIIVELTADCPLADPKMIDEVVREYKNSEVDYISNSRPYTFPEGFDVEVFSFENLKWVSENVFDLKVREHVSKYFYDNPDMYRIANYRSEEINRPNWHLSVDEYSDFLLVKTIFEKIYPEKPDFTVYDVVSFLDENPEIRKLMGKYRGI